MKTYLINLDRRPDRLAEAMNCLAANSVSFERFPAIDGKEYTGTSTQKPGVIGCALSHYFIVERAKMLGMDMVMIFEDDVALCSDFQSRLSEFLNALPENWHMAYLGGAHQQVPVRINDHVLQVSKTLTTHAYIIRASMYDVVLDQLRNFADPVDSLYADLQKKYNVYVSDPPLAWQRKSYSDIENGNVDYEWLKSNTQ